MLEQVRRRSSQKLKKKLGKSERIDMANSIEASGMDSQQLSICSKTVLPTELEISPSNFFLRI